MRLLCPLATWCLDSMWQYEYLFRFHPLFSPVIGNSMPLASFIGKHALSRRLLRLADFYRHTQKIHFADFICSKNLSGFNLYWHSVTDYSEYFKVDLHAVMMSCKYNIIKRPSLICLRLSFSKSKDFKGITKLNVRVIRDHLSRITVSLYGSNTSDYANNEQK